MKGLKLFDEIKVKPNTSMNFLKAFQLIKTNSVMECLVLLRHFQGKYRLLYLEFVLQCKNTKLAISPQGDDKYLSMDIVYVWKY